MERKRHGDLHLLCGYFLGRFLKSPEISDYTDYEDDYTDVNHIDRCDLV